MSGKNFSCNNTGKRKKSDFYETPYSMTSRFLDKEFFNHCGLVWECASGQNSIVKVLKSKLKHSRIIFSDLAFNADFLQIRIPVDAIITNPPFSKAFEFVLHAKKLCKKKFAFLLPLSYLHGKNRFDKIYNDKAFQLTKVYVFTRYPMLGDALRLDGKYKTGMMVYAWFVWENGQSKYNKPVIDWIDNNSDVLKKGE